MPAFELRLPELHRGQNRRRAEIERLRARFVVTMCGRRWGKSMDGGEWLMEGCASGLKCALFTPTYKYLMDEWRDIAARFRPLLGIPGARLDQQEKRLELPNGGVIECWSLDTPDPGRGRKYHRMVVDEAGIVRDLEGVWQSALRPTLVDYRGSAWFYGTPKGRKHGFAVLFAKGESGDPGWMSFRAPTIDNPYIPEDEIEAARRDTPPEAFAQEYEGIPADDGANPFGWTAIQRCTVDRLSDKKPVVWGWDFARAQDWTVGIALDEDGAVCRFERWQLKPWGETMQNVVSIAMTGGVVIAYGDSTGLGRCCGGRIAAIGGANARGAVHQAREAEADGTAGLRDPATTGDVPRWGVEERVGDVRVRVL